MSHRREQMASTLQRAVQQVISRGLQDPRVRGLITVTGVEVGADLKTASVSVSILPDERQELVMHGLKHAAAHIRRQVGDLVAVRQMPTLTFRLDLSLKRQAEVYQAIARATAERPPPPPGSDSSATAGDPAAAPGVSPKALEDRALQEPRP